ncbi:hypothetical protein F4054_00070 [Candidatus Poribacteria bacterium]|nr:hypothetical protein [Candidatus Poribacteria bacterium]MYK20641.1 hypothetical protein [Candidatus Poribacteria bacterium]
MNTQSYDRRTPQTRIVGGGAPDASIDPRNRGVEEASLDTPELVQAIAHNLPEVDPSQIDRFIQQYRRLEHLKAFLESTPTAREGCEPLLDKAVRALSYQRPYRIALVGRTGVGKTQVLNTLVGRELLASQQGQPVTGTVTEIFQDTSDSEERAVIRYRDMENIRSLIQRELIERFGLTDADFVMPDELSGEFATAFREIEPPVGNDPERFKNVQTALANVMDQYLRFKDEELPTEFCLTDNAACAKLNALITENSERNQVDKTRIVGLIHSVAYYIHGDVDQESVPELRLPRNTCLVDLPGISGSPLHDIIIAEGIQDADAVVFIVNPKRVGQSDEKALVGRIREAIGLNGELDAAEQIFLVLNAIDESAVDPERMDRAPMTELARELYADSGKMPNRDGDMPYFELSALAAALARTQLQGGTIEDPRKYAAIVQTLAPEAVLEQAGANPEIDHRAVLARSGISKLVTSLNDFAGERVAKQIQTADAAITKIVNRLISQYQMEIASKSSKTSGDFESYDEEQLVQRCRELEDLLLTFRNTQLRNKAALTIDLRNAATKLCDDVDAAVREQLPYLWKKNVTRDTDIVRAVSYYNVQARQLVSEVEVMVWSELTFRLKYLATSLVDHYETAFAADEIQKRLIDASYGHPLATEAFGEDAITALSAEMQRGLEAFSERLILAFLPEPAFRFISPGQDTRLKAKSARGNLSGLPGLPKETLTAINGHANGGKASPLSTDLMAIVAQIPPTLSVEPSSFDRFIQAVRERYESVVLVDSVNALVNVYEYEMLKAERCLLTTVEKLFRQFRDTRLSDPALFERMLRDTTDLTVRQEINDLNMKIDELTEIQRSPEG